MRLKNKALASPFLRPCSTANKKLFRTLKAPRISEDHHPIRKRRNDVLNMLKLQILTKWKSSNLLEARRTTPHHCLFPTANFSRFFERNHHTRRSKNTSSLQKKLCPSRAYDELRQSLTGPASLISVLQLGLLPFPSLMTSSLAILKAKIDRRLQMFMYLLREKRHEDSWLYLDCDRGRTR